MSAARRSSAAASGTSDGLTADQAAAAGSAVTRTRRLAASPATVVIGVATLLALALRLFLLTRPGFLTSGTVEYDDGVYLGASLRLLHGALPYRDYAFVQPPGIILVAFPAALFSTVTSQAAGLALARVLSVLASTACVPLAGNLLRHRGALAAGIAAGVLAVFPADIVSSRTLLLEPWMNLCCMLAATAAFRAGRLASPRRLAWAGIALGFATAIKFWAAIPAALLLLTCLLIRSPRGGQPEPDGRRAAGKWADGPGQDQQRPDGLGAGQTAAGTPAWSRARRACALLGGLVVGFAVPVVPLAAGAPVAFVRETLLDQASRVGTATPLSMRLAHLTGLVTLLGKDGKFEFTGPPYTLFAEAANASSRVVYVGWPAFAAAAVIIILIGAGYLRGWRQRTAFDWFALATAAVASVAILSYSAFFYHYPDFPAPWLAIAVGVAIASLASPVVSAIAGRTAASPATAADRAAIGGHATGKEAPDDVASGSSVADDRAAPRRTIAPARALGTRVVAGVAALVIALIAVLEAKEIAPVKATPSPAAAAAIPAGACVVADQISFLIAADRFAPPQADCPDLIDSLAQTLVLSGGVSVQGGAGQRPGVVDGWEKIFGQAQYVWLSFGASSRIPWTPALNSWFNANFRLLAALPSYGDSNIYVHR